MEAEPILSSSQESVGTLFANNLPSGLLYQECSDDFVTIGEGGGGDGYDNITDYDLAAAEKQARESGSITPLVKQELKLLIQTRRLSAGKDELRVGFARPSTHQVNKPLTELHDALFGHEPGVRINIIIITSHLIHSFIHSFISVVSLRD